MVSDTKRKKLVILDSHAIIHRAYHAFPSNLRTTDGQVVNAAYGYASMLLSTVADLSPDYIVATFDSDGPTFRHTMFSGYKANRGAPDEDLINQFPLVKEIVEAFNIPIFELKGYEADDLIGAISTQVAADVDVFIMTADNDILQLVNKHINVMLPGKSFSDMRKMDIAGVEAKFGFGPKSIIDYKALRGDPSDNIPGVKGVGDKTAKELLLQYKDLDGIYNNIEDIKPRYSKLLSESYEEAYLSKKLATIDTETPIKFELEKCKVEDYDKEQVMDLFRKLEFRSLINKLPSSRKELDQAEMFGTDSPKVDIYKDSGYELVVDKTRLLEIIKILRRDRLFAFDTETDGLDPNGCNILGLSISSDSIDGIYVPVRTIKENNQLNEAGKQLSELFSDEKVYKVAQNAKFDVHSMLNAGIKVDGVVFDTMIAAFVLNMGMGKIGLKHLAFTRLNMTMEEITDLAEFTSKKNFDIGLITEDRLYKYACRDADATLRLFKLFSSDLLRDDNIRLEKSIDIYNSLLKSSEVLVKLLLEIEFPLLKVLVGMERYGVRLDEKYLKKFGQELEQQLSSLVKEIYEVVGHEFNMNSPKQLGQILFEELNLPITKKLKTGGYSTNEDYLARMTTLHPIIPLVLSYREAYKLKSTYVDALLKIQDKETKKIYTQFNQTIVVTGRLSSYNPNLQNIPVRTEAGQKIREAFVSDEGKTFVGFDYSQQEMRILAHMANEEKMIQAFETGLDIHSYTASQIFSKGMESVTKEERNQAKTINFGVIYGISSFGLSDRLEIAYEKAQEFIDRFFDEYPNVKVFYDELIKGAMSQGYIETMYGRRKNTLDLSASNPRIRNKAYRESINFPIQGSAADMVKLAMIKVDKIIDDHYPDASLVLQIHDELIFEAPEDDGYIRKFKEEITDTMENIVKMKVRNRVDSHVAKAWGQLK